MQLPSSCTSFSIFQEESPLPVAPSLRSSREYAGNLQLVAWLVWPLSKLKLELKLCLLDNYYVNCLKMHRR